MNEEDPPQNGSNSPAEFGRNEIEESSFDLSDHNGKDKKVISSDPLRRELERRTMER